MGKRGKRAKGSVKVRSIVPQFAKVHPMVAAADIPAAQRARATYEVAAVPNPYGEFVQGGKITRHKVVRRVAGWRIIAVRPGVSQEVLDLLDTLAMHLETAEAGIVKSSLNFAGGGGSAACHIPFSEVRVRARDAADWALSFLRPDERKLVVLMLTTNVGFGEAAGVMWPRLNLAYATAKASSLFRIAANTLLANCGSRLLAAA